MIKILRRKFMMITMSIIAVVLLVSVLIISIFSYQGRKSEVKEELDQGIRFVAEERGDMNPQGEIIPLFPDEREGDRKGGKFNPKDESFNTFIFAVLVDQNGNVLNEFNANSVDETLLNSVIKELLNEDEQEGTLSDYNLLYKKLLTNKGVAIAFTSSDSLDSNFRKTIGISIVSYFGVLALLFGVNLFISRLALKPVSEAWEKQKQFIQDASHDLKTPLTVILANNNILMSHKDDTIESQQDWLNSTQDEANHMRALIDAMLESAKTENLKNNIVLSEINLSEVTMGLALQFEPVAFEKGITIDTNIDDNVKTLSDETSYYRMLSTLVDNAIKYADSDSQIKIALRNGKHNTIILSVNNQGEVISDEDIKHLFERFYRSEKARNSEGYGLGLSICKNLAEALNGKISCKSNKEEGTTFTVVFKK